MALKDGGKTIVTGAIDKGKIRLNFISSSTGETSSILKLNNSVLKYARETPLYKLYITQNNIFVYFRSLQGPNLLKINTNDKSQSLPFAPFSYTPIIPVSNGELFNRSSDKNGTISTDIWEITDNGDIKNRKSFSDKALSILGSDQKHVSRWSKSSPYQGPIFNIDRQTIENQMSLPSGTLLLSAIYRDGTFLSSRTDGEGYLVAQLLSPGGSKDLSEISGKLPYVYQNKALKTSGRLLQAPLQGSIYVWDMKQQQFKYFLPRQGIIQKISISPDGKTLAVTEAGGEMGFKKKDSQVRLTVWDLPTGQLLRDIGIDSAYVSLAFTTDSKTLVTADQNTNSNISVISPQFSNDEISLWNVDQLRNP
jgi:hypothetical protein